MKSRIRMSLLVPCSPLQHAEVLFLIAEESVTASIYTRDYVALHVASGVFSVHIHFTCD